MIRSAAVFFALAATTAQADMSGHGPIMITAPIAYETAKSAPSGAGYFTVTNSGDADDVLLKVMADFPQVMIHETTEENGIARMSHVMSVPVPAGETVAFEPGGLHVMFMGLNGDPLEAGETVPATLVFEKAGEVAVNFDVISRRAKTETHDHSGH